MRFRDAELLAEEIDDTFGFSNVEALAGYEQKRNEAVMPMYQLTCDLAKPQPPPQQMQSFFAALRDNEEQSGPLLGPIASTVPILEFFSPENVRRITDALWRFERHKRLSSNSIAEYGDRS
jgi:hypothetical protein